jgi:hypothetical protein
MKFEYRSNGHIVTLQATIYSKGSMIMIGYIVLVDGKMRKMLNTREILSSDEESEKRKFIAAKMFAQLAREERANNPTKKVSFADYKKVQEYEPEFDSIFFPTTVGTIGGHLIDEPYIVGIDDEVVVCRRLRRFKSVRTKKTHGPCAGTSC